MNEPTPESDADAESGSTWFERLRKKLRLLYHGHSAKAIQFQRAVLLVDLAIIAFFVATPLLRGQPSYLWIDLAVALLLFADLAARTLASTHIWRRLRQPTTLVDIFILVTLLLPAWLANLGFLRILRLWTLSRSGFLWLPLRRRGLQEWEEPAKAIVNLATFLFLVSGFIFTFFARPDSGIEGYVDALYYTVTTVTTTGFGDIILPGTWGRLTAILVMVFGLGLFFQLAQAVFRPHKVHYPCPNCGLSRHDPDAVHCKACGNQLAIPDEGR